MEKLMKILVLFGTLVAALGIGYYASTCFGNENPYSPRVMRHLHMIIDA
jgi:hypothetical protein